MNFSTDQNLNPLPDDDLPSGIDFEDLLVQDHVTDEEIMQPLPPEDNMGQNSPSVRTAYSDEREPSDYQDFAPHETNFSTTLQATQSANNEAVNSLRYLIAPGRMDEESEEETDQNSTAFETERLDLFLQLQGMNEEEIEFTAQKATDKGKGRTLKEKSDKFLLRIISKNSAIRPTGKYQKKLKLKGSKIKKSGVQKGSGNNSESNTEQAS